MQTPTSPNEPRSTRSFARALTIAATVAAIHAFSTNASAVSTPTFTSGPVVVDKAFSFFPPATGTSFIFGYMSGKLYVVNKVVGGVGWKLTDCHHHTIAGNYDGDPGAAFLSPNDQNTTIMNCGHAATGPGYMYCMRGHLNDVPNGHYDPAGDDAPYQLGTGTFNPGSSPSMANTFYQGANGIVLFALGQNGQIWYAGYHVPSNSWNSWFMVPPPYLGSFNSNPAVTTYTSAGDLVMVCARLAATNQIACNKQEYGNGGSIHWAGWVTVSSFPTVGFKPSLVRSTNLVHLFGVGYSSTVQTSSFPVGGGTWSSVTQVGNAVAFISGPAETASLSYPGTQVMSVAKGTDSAFYFSSGSAQFGWTNWQQIQVN
jgi:hypothetical protein